MNPAEQEDVNDIALRESVAPLQIESVHTRLQVESNRHRRRLKVEADGMSWTRPRKPKIRLMGRWLEKAGFKPGTHVDIICVAPGIMELRSSHAANEKSPEQITLNRD